MVAVADGDTRHPLEAGLDLETIQTELGQQMVNCQFFCLYVRTFTRTDLPKAVPENVKTGHEASLQGFRDIPCSLFDKLYRHFPFH